VWGFSDIISTLQYISRKRSALFQLNEDAIVQTSITLTTFQRDTFDHSVIYEHLKVFSSSINIDFRPFGTVDVSLLGDYSGWGPIS
jgi:hypothetical protein